jgi:hypothetical protein
MTTEESYVHVRPTVPLQQSSLTRYFPQDNIKKAMIAASERDTTHIFRTLHNTARVFK